MTEAPGYEAIKARHKGNGRADAAPRFRLIPFDEITQTPGSRFVVKNLIPAEGLTVVWGAPKCGKTFWVFDLAMHIALGREYRGRRVAQGPVIYIACEGERGLSARTEAFRRTKLTPADVANFFLLPTRLDLVAEAGLLIGDIQAQVGDGNCAAIVIDTLNRSLNGSESSDEDMGAYVKAADAIREAFSCAVVVIHHCGIDDKRPRGHTSLAGAADAQIAVRRAADDTIVATVEFMKDGEAGAELSSRLRVVDLDLDEDGEPVTSCVIEPAASTVAAQGSPKKVNAAAKQAHTLLLEAVAAGGSPAPASEHIPAGRKGVTKTVWRGYCEKGGIINPEGSPREQLRRFVVTLKDAGMIGVWDDFIWPISGRHKTEPK
jgi:hypothetical protein